MIPSGLYNRGAKQLLVACSIGSPASVNAPTVTGEGKIREVFRVSVCYALYDPLFVLLALLASSQSGSYVVRDESGDVRLIIFDENRASDSPVVETVWHCRSGQASTFLSRAVSQWEIVIMKQHGTMSITVRGPETRATTACCPEEAEFLGITFTLGTFMPLLPTTDRLDGEVILPLATKRSFWLYGAAWQFPDYNNADTFVDRLLRVGLLVRDPIVDAALQGHLKEYSLRTVQRRFLRATGLTVSAVRQIERAHKAEALLERGVSILDTVELAGYADQAHLTRSLKRFVGRTPAQVSGNVCR
ncbi:helix-turn-helix protein [Thermosporothrix hazakensis]|uniref:Helix-turn-helix protein n=1 Tax=Thermosporothrix hazakensis TaxID=644383 RepID=A0A326U8W0_THEHA|nr:helix-turn-helix protein [Thermosporothrix hazakensis]